MLNKLIYFLKKLLNFNSTKCLPVLDFVRNDASVTVGNNFNLADVENDIKSNTNTTDIKFKNTKDDEQELDEDLLNLDLVSVALGQKEIEKDANKIEFKYNEDKIQEMNKKIDYYKKNTDELYSLTLAEILEINFYYQKRLEKLKNSNN